MSLPRLPQLGSVVWVELEDANGIPKLRPAIVVTATADIAAGKPVRVVAITTASSHRCPTIMCCCLGTGKARRARACAADAPPWPVGRRWSRSATYNKWWASYRPR